MATTIKNHRFVPARRRFVPTDCHLASNECRLASTQRTFAPTQRRLAPALVLAFALLLLAALIYCTVPFAYAANADDASDSTQDSKTVRAKKTTTKSKLPAFATLTVTDTKSKTDKKLSYDSALIEAIGCQAQSGHMVCCPGYACAYGDAIITGEVHDHSEYGCGCCVWTNWGGGNSSYRCVGTDTELLREAYDQIKSGKPVVIHVTGPTAEHWICLIGYTNVTNPNDLSLSNFWALDPYDGEEIIAGDTYYLYGDGCEHISDRECEDA